MGVPDDEEISEATIAIFDLSGRIVKRMAGINTKQVSISAQGLKPGIYLYQVTEQGKTLGGGKMVITE